ncbi:MAG: DNA-binding protein [Phycisphaerae bacterium]|nr:DNA-binding protein [Phycisphaerae bacterium]
MTLDLIDLEQERAYPPRQSDFTKPFWDNLTRGIFTTTRCDSCNRPSFPPKPICPHCWTDQVSWIELEGAGTLYSKTTVHAGPAAFVRDLPYSVGIIDLDEGLRIAARIIGDVNIGDRVELVVLSYIDGPLYAAKRYTVRLTSSA